jgi:hypothetical protein
MCQLNVDLTPTETDYRHKETAKQAFPRTVQITDPEILDF